MPWPRCTIRPAKYAAARAVSTIGPWRSSAVRKLLHTSGAVVVLGAVEGGDVGLRGGLAEPQARHRALEDARLGRLDAPGRGDACLARDVEEHAGHGRRARRKGTRRGLQGSGVFRPGAGVSSGPRPAPPIARVKLPRPGPRCPLARRYVVVDGDVTDPACIARLRHHVPSDSSTSNGGRRTTSASRAVAARVGRPPTDSYTSRMRSSGIHEPHVTDPVEA